MEKTSRILIAICALAATFHPIQTSASREPRVVHASAFREPKVDFWLTVLHNNDGESQLIDAGGSLTNFGGVARFTTLVHELKDEAVGRPRGKGRFSHPARPWFPYGKRGVVMVSSGDNFLAGPEFNASLEKGFPYYDSIAATVIGYDAMTIGNHEFDFGPDVLATFIVGVQPKVPFISANLDVSGERKLQLLERWQRIAPSTIIKTGSRWVGIIGATTPRLPFISSPRNVVVDPEVAAAVQAEIDYLSRWNVDIIIVSSHLQSVEEDKALAAMISGADIMIAGGGDELLANPWNSLIPGDAPVDVYPIFTPDAEGNPVPVITTSGAYRYVGKFVAGFDKRGNLIAIDDLESGPVRVAGGSEPDAVEPNHIVQKAVVEPVQEAVQSLAENVIGSSDVPLDGRRSSVRTMESNEGNLCADSLLWQAAQLAASFGVPAPNVALQNGGGIRNDNILPAGSLTELDTFNILPFANFVSVVPAIPAAQFKEILENAVSRVEFVDGRFAQVAGFAMTYTANATAQQLDADGNVVVAGQRVLEVTLGDGTPILSSGVVVAGAPDINIATIDFLARSGDQYPYRGASFATIGVTYQQALSNYIQDGLGGVVSAADYPEGGEGRITRVP